MSKVIKVKNFKKYKYYPAVIFLVSTLTVVLFSFPLMAAEKIFFVYGGLEESLKVSSLETFAEDGTIDKNLAYYMNLVNADEKEKALFQEVLTTKVDIDPVILSRLMKTDEGERLLNFFGEIINIRGGRNGKLALRGAMITASLEPEGLTLLNFLRQLSVDVQIDVTRALSFAEDMDIILHGTEVFIEKVAELSAQESEKTTIRDYSKLPDLKQPGSFDIEKKIWEITDSERLREFYVWVYQPQKWRPGKTPVIIFSHGLNSKPENYIQRAKHLASYGFVVVMPQHPGSDDIYGTMFTKGYYPDVSDLEEFINRPLDITYVLDELERRNESEFEGRLDLKNVGLFGHSYGGYTALAVAGATPAPNFLQLEQGCSSQIEQFNVALLLECRALNLERQSYDFRDERIQAVVVINPVNASIFGEEAMSQIKIPIAMGGGSDDPVTPFILEQVRSFPWISSPEKYLVLEEGRTHVDISEIDGGSSKLLTMLPDIHLASTELLSEYNKALILAFFEFYIAKNSDYSPYLHPSYAEYLSEDKEFKVFMITEDSNTELVEAIAKFKRENR